jgi:hypothetical protein
MIMVFRVRKNAFFKLPYWKDNFIRHNLDIMHIEKNVMDNIIGTLLDMNGKTKDNLKACKDLHKMGLRLELHLITKDNGRTYMPAACYTMSNVDKSNFLKVLKNVKVPDTGRIIRGITATHPYTGRTI